MPVMPVQKMKAGDVFGGFRVVKVSKFPESFIVAYEFVHEKSGARMIHLHTDDKENMFSVNFPTPPSNSTGLPHIMEHSVLAGSVKFPVRDPFFEMYKMSMATFINAMTGGDCTYYPVCSNVRADLFNLADVYFDAVFHPLLEESTFKREGHHLAPEDPEDPKGPLTVNGIVYNEMKSYYSQPEEQISREITSALFPDTCFKHDSGGNPNEIPSLTYDQFLEFHRVWYHPSNARIVCYGDIEPQAFLEFLDPRLNEFSKIVVQPKFANQPRWTAPRSLDGVYANEEDTDKEKTFLALSWVTTSGLDVENYIAQNIISSVLLGDDAAPLKRAITDSGLGLDTIPSGITPVGPDCMFSVGIRGSEPERLDAFRDLVLKTISDVCEKKPDPELVETAFNRLAYTVREIQPGRPLKVANDLIAPWILGADPLLYFGISAKIDACHAKWKANPAWLSDVMRKELVENPHRLDYRLVPDKKLQEKSDKAFSKKMEAVRKTISDSEAEKIAATDAELQKKAGTPNSPEALATLPQLGLSDIPRLPQTAKHSIDNLGNGVPFIHNDIYANGVNYLALSVNLEGLPTDLWKYIPVYTEAFTKMGAAGRDFAETARRTSAATGDISCCEANANDASVPGLSHKNLFISMKALDNQMSAAMDVLADKICSLDTSDTGRFRDIITQASAGHEASLVESGCAPVSSELLGAIDEIGYISALQSGRFLRRTYREILDNFDIEAPKALNAIERIAKFIRNRRRYIASFTGSDSAAEKTSTALMVMMNDFSNDSVSFGEPIFVEPQTIPRIALVAPMQVSHCVQVVKAPGITDPCAPYLMLGMELLKVDYMISELRFKGNAYGASCAYNSGSIKLSTYADPHISRSFKVFRDLPKYISDKSWSKEELTRGIISAVKAFFRPMRPEVVTGMNLTRFITNTVFEKYLGRYEAIRSATPEKVKEALLASLENTLDNSPCGVVTSKDKITAANSEPGFRKFDIAQLLSD